MIALSIASDARWLLPYSLSLSANSPVINRWYSVIARMIGATRRESGNDSRERCTPENGGKGGHAGLGALLRWIQG